tara:strand:- start:384 stop:776 length:393 start_codon:yes stop_codon:yes gene_type:complete
MGKKSMAQRRWEAQPGRFAPPEHQPVDKTIDDDPIKVLANLKKEQLIDYYSAKYGLAKNMLINIWDFLEKSSPAKIKAIRKGQVKNTLKRTEYRDGDILKNGVVIGNALDNTLKKAEEKELNDKDEIVVV